MAKLSGLADGRPMARHAFLFCVLSPIVVWFCVLRLQIPNAQDAEAAGVFASFWGSGWALSHGMDPYTQTPFTPTLGAALFPLPEINLNPPVLLPLFQLSAKLDIGTALQVSTIISAVLFLAGSASLVCRRASLSLFKVSWLFLIPYFYNAIFLGQIYALFFALATCAWAAMSRGRWLPAGLAIGALIAMRPIFSLWLVLLWLAGHRRLACAATAVAAAATVASAVVYGPATLVHWVNALASDKHAVLGINASLNGYIARLGHPTLALIASAAIVVGAGLWARRTRADALEVSLLALTASMLASPLSWVDYTTLLIPALLARPWGGMLGAAALLLCLPMQLPLAESLDPGWKGALACAAYPLALLLIAAECALRNRAAAVTSVRATEPAGAVAFGA